MIKVVCQHCEASLKVKNAKAGEKGKCPRCGGEVVIPDTGKSSLREMLRLKIEKMIDEKMNGIQEQMKGEMESLKAEISQGEEFLNRLDALEAGLGEMKERISIFEEKESAGEGRVNELGERVGKISSESEGLREFLLEELAEKNENVLRESGEKIEQIRQEFELKIQERFEKSEEGFRVSLEERAVKIRQEISEEFEEQFSDTKDMGEPPLFEFA